MNVNDKVVCIRIPIKIKEFREVIPMTVGGIYTVRRYAKFGIIAGSNIPTEVIWLDGFHGELDSDGREIGFSILNFLPIINHLEIPIITCQQNKGDM